jgi:hypothetical protein
MKVEPVLIYSTGVSVATVKHVSIGSTGLVETRTFGSRVI